MATYKEGMDVRTPQNEFTATIYMDRLFSLALALLLAAGATSIPIDALAQQRGGTGGTISGIVVDDGTGDAIESATVAVWRSADSSLATGTITGAEGEFEIEGLRPDEYYVKISFVGFETTTIDDVTLGRGNMTADVGRVRLVSDTEQLDEVLVEEERDFMEVGIDKTVYNTREQLVSVGGSATDVLENIPSVEVDIDGNISLRGSQNVAIHINGKPTSMSGEALASFLQGLPSSALERVEVIPNPSARYEPEGMSGILNIVLRQDQDRGFGGSATVGGSTQSEYNASSLLNYQRGNWNSFVNYSFRRRTRDSEGDRFRLNKFEDPTTALSQDDLGERGGFSHTVNGNVDYSLSKNSTLSYSSMVSRRTGNSNGLVAYRVTDANEDLIRRYRRETGSDRFDLNFDQRLSFQRIVDPGSNELSAEVQFEHETESDESIYEQQDLTMSGDPADQTPELQAVEQDEKNMEISAKVDYIRPLGNGKLEAGYKGDFESLDNSFYSESFDHEAGGYVPDVSLNNSFIYDEVINAAYVMGSQELGRFGAQVGVRMEQAYTTFDLTTTNETFNNSYFSIFPSAHLSYALQEGNEGRKQIRLAYSKRVRRPNTWQMNPFDDFEDPLFRRVGNPYLTPEYTHAFEVSYVQFTGAATLSISPYFRRTVDEISWHQNLTDDGVSIVTFENFDTSDSWGAELNGSLRLGEWINLNANFNAYRVVTDGSNVESDLGNDALGWSARGNGMINLGSGLALQLSYFYRAPMDIENGRIGSFSRTNLAIRQQLFNRKANLSVRLSDPFDVSGFRIQREDERFLQRSFRSWDSRQVSLTFTYNFGNRQEERRRRGEFEGGEGNGEGMENMQ